MKRLLLILVLFATANQCKAQLISSLDPTFSTIGVYINDTGVFKNVIIQSDSKIIALGGPYYSTRILNTGTPDYSFNNNVKDILPPFSGQAFYNLNLQPDEKILLVGKMDYSLLLARLKTNGTLDNSFGDSGISVIDFPGQETIYSVALRPDGKIIAAGNRQAPEDALFVIRCQPDGTLDSTFGTNGEVHFDWSWGYFDYPTTNDVAVLPDGRIVVGATTRINATGNYCFTALRLLSDGSPDTSFNHSGLAYINLGGWLSYCKAMQVQPDGKILLVGHSDSITVARFDTTGVLDNGFGNNGIVRLELGSGNAITLQPDGKILIGGSAADTAFLLYRLLSDGTIDNGFGTDGRIITKILDQKNKINGLAVQADGKILACGEGENFPWPNNYPKAIMVRYLENGTGVEHIKTESSHFSIFPNPASAQLTIAYQNGAEVVANVTVTDITGRTMISRKDQRFGSSTIEINTRELASGVYFLSITNGKGLNQQFKFVKK